jgi:hypothetical protein
MAGVSLHWPADRFYWAVLDTTGMPRARSRRARERQLGYQLERYLPVPLEQVQATYLRLHDHRVLACAVEQDRLADLDHNVVTLAPQAVPRFVEEPVDAGSLNLLTAEREPRIVKSARARCRLELAAAVLLITLIGTLGLVRRAQWHDRRASETAGMVADVYDQILESGPSVLPSSLRLKTELRRLRQTHASPVANTAPRDAGAALASLLSAWPPGLELQTESIVVTESQITITALLDTHEQVQALADAVGGVVGWTISQPTFHEFRGRVRGTIRLTRKEDGP